MIEKGMKFKPGQRVLNTENVGFVIAGPPRTCREISIYQGIVTCNPGDADTLFWPIRREDGSDAGWHNEKFLRPAPKRWLPRKETS